MTLEVPTMSMEEPPAITEVMARLDIRMYLHKPTYEIAFTLWEPPLAERELPGRGEN